MTSLRPSIEDGRVRVNAFFANRFAKADAFPSEESNSVRKAMMAGGIAQQFVAEPCNFRILAVIQSQSDDCFHQQFYMAVVGGGQQLIAMQ